MSGGGASETSSAAPHRSPSLPITPHRWHYCLNQPPLPPQPRSWKTCLPPNWSLVPKKLGTAALEHTCAYGTNAFLVTPACDLRFSHRPPHVQWGLIISRSSEHLIQSSCIVREMTDDWTNGFLLHRYILSNLESCHIYKTHICILCHVKQTIYFSFSICQKKDWETLS